MLFRSPADQRWQSFVLCGLVELPLAALCLWLSYHTHQIAGRRIRLMLRQEQRLHLHLGSRRRSRGP